MTLWSRLSVCWRAVIPPKDAVPLKLTPSVEKAFGWVRSVIVTDTVPSPSGSVVVMGIGLATFTVELSVTVSPGVGYSSRPGY